MNFLDASQFGNALADGYSIQRAVSTYRMPALHGRPRYRMKDSAPTYRVSLSYEFDDQQFALWQSFWQATNNGLDPFWVRLKLSTNDVYQEGEYTLVQPVAQWRANGSFGINWTVTLDVEVNGASSVIGTICDVVYGGPIFMPAADNIYGGPIDNLATDVYGPCPGVLNAQ